MFKRPSAFSTSFAEHNWIKNQQPADSVGSSAEGTAFTPPFMAFAKAKVWQLSCLGNRNVVPATGETVRRLIKRGNKRHLLKVRPAELTLLHTEELSITKLIDSKDLSDPVFSQARDLTRSISRVKFTMKINSVLKRAKLCFGECLRSYPPFGFC